MICIGVNKNFPLLIYGVDFVSASLYITIQHQETVCLHVHVMSALCTPWVICSHEHGMMCKMT
jgi:hypothetical protein